MTDTTPDPKPKQRRYCPPLKRRPIRKKVDPNDPYSILLVRDSRLNQTMSSTLLCWLADAAVAREITVAQLVEDTLIDCFGKIPYKKTVPDPRVYWTHNQTEREFRVKLKNFAYDNTRKPNLRYNTNVFDARSIYLATKEAELGSTRRFFLPRSVQWSELHELRAKNLERFREEEERERIEAEYYGLSTSDEQPNP